MPDTQNEVMTVTEVAKYLRVDKRVVYKLIASGELNAKLVGNAYRVFKSTLRTYINGETNE